MSGLLSNRLIVPPFLMRVFHLKELHMLNRGHRNGLSSCWFGCRLGCHLGSRFDCTLGGFGTKLGSFGGRLGSRFGRGLQPLWQAVCLRNIMGEIQFPVGKNICQTPYTTSTLCPHNLCIMSAHRERTSVLQVHSHVLPPYRSAHMRWTR